MILKSLNKFWMLLLAIQLLFACNNPKSSDDSSHPTIKHQKYTCPMHPQINQDKPGTCPICNMDLVLVADKSTDAASLMLSESQIQLANVTTIRVGEGTFNTSKVLNGRLVTNPEQSELISSRVAGRIERLFVKETGRKINKGEPVMQVFSETLQVLQQDYLLQIKQAAAFPGEKIYQSLRTAAKSKLKLAGLSESQIKAVERTNKVSPLVIIYAAASGVVNEISVSEGQYVAEGSPVLRLENFNRLWLEADVYPSEINQVTVGSMLKISVNGLPGTQQAKVDFISPALNASTQRLTIRAAVDNSTGNFQSGMQATVFLSTGKLAKAVSLPLEAVIRDESGAFVWIKSKGNTFTSRKVITGAEDATQIVVTSGLNNGEEVVSTGAYLLHSEFTLKKGIIL